jgi:hypothetical protein
LIDVDSEAAYMRYKAGSGIPPFRAATSVADKVAKADLRFWTC